MLPDRELYPFESHFLLRNDLKYHYLDEGRGETVVMVHGNPTWSFYWRNLALALRSQYRVIVPDHMGCGLSDKPDDAHYRYTLDQRVDDLEALLEHLGLRENITLVLHDWGGMIGMAYATRHPERIKRLVVMNTAAFLLPPAKKFPLALWLVRNTALGSFLVRGFNAFSFGASVIGTKRAKLGAKVRKAYRAPYDTWSNRIATLRFVQDIPLKEGDPAWTTCHGVQENLQQFKNIPLLICWGEKDFVFSVEFLEEWIRRFPDAQVHRWSDGGHYILEDAADEITQLVKDFLREHPLEVAA